MGESNGRPPSATFYHSATWRTKRLKCSEGGGWGGVGGCLLRRHLNKQLKEKKKQGLSRMTSFSNDKSNGDRRRA